MKILLSSGVNAQYYIDAIEGLGAEAVAKYLPDVDINYDGLILCGGNDIDPKYYGEQIAGAVSIDAQRDRAEFALLKAYIDAGKPVLGICRGHQLINVFFGGTLYQHLPKTESHRSADGTDLIHSVNAIPKSILYDLYGDSFFVNSYHHQAIKDLGENLRATAYWNNQYIEACEHSSLPVFSVQWHPERMCFTKARKDTICGADIIKYFIETCEAYRKK